MAQILDPGTADRAETRERCGVWTHAHREIDPSARAFQWCAEMRRAQKDQMVEALHPSVACERCVVAGAARYQSTRAVAHHDEMLDWVRVLHYWEVDSAALESNPKLSETPYWQVLFKHQRDLERIQNL